MIGKGQQFVQQLKFLLREYLGTAVDGYGQIDVIQTDVVKLQLFLEDDLGPAQKRFYAQQQFIHINGFYHIVVNPQFEAFELVREGVLCRDHKDRKLITVFPELLCQIIAVHVRHHQICDDEIDIGFVQHGQGFFSVKYGGRLIAVFLQYSADQFVQRLIVFHN